MNAGYSRRRFLASVGAGASLIASPVLAQTSWRITGSPKGDVRLVFYTDIHADGTDETTTAMAKAAEAINAQRPDLVLCGGDMIAGGFGARAEDMTPRWDAYMGMVRDIKADHHAVIGNHDLVGARPKDGSPPSDDPRLAFKQRFGQSQTYGAFDANGYRFILLDSLRISNGPYRYVGWVSSEQLDWLRGLLSSTPVDMPIVLTLHVPLLTSFFAATEGNSFQTERNRAVYNNTEVLNLFAEHNLILVLQGHLHVNEAIQWRGTTFLTSGAVSGGWWRGAYFGAEEGFSAITLKEDRIELEYIDYGWDAGR